jgi:ArsR family transcriptional regulator
MLTNKQIAKISKGLNGTDQRAIFKVLGDTNRYRIFEMLGEESRLAVSDIAKILKISMPLASQHLKILEQAKILKKEKVGQKVFYKLRTDNRIAKSIAKDVL